MDYLSLLIRESKRDILICAGLLLSVSVFLLIATWETVYYRSRSPQPLQQKILVELGRPSWHTYRYVIVNLKGNVDTGYQIVRTGHNDNPSKEEPVSDIVLIYVGNTPVICEIPSGFSRSVISGGLTRVPSRIKDKVVLDDMLQGEDGYRNREIYYFKGHDQNAAAYVFFFLGIVVMAFFTYTALLAYRWFFAAGDSSDCQDNLMFWRIQAGCNEHRLRDQSYATAPRINNILAQLGITEGMVQHTCNSL